MQLPSVITIDGPAGAGKSTLGELLARRLGYLYFDTGVMYRALTLAALRHGCDLHNGAALEELARQTCIEVQAPTCDDGRQYTVTLDGDDVTWAIRTPDVDRNVSLVSGYSGVRREMVRQQRVIGARGRVVMVGRDIGSVVMPNAALKIYLEASLDERSRRRASDQRQRGYDLPLEQIRADIARRDELDRHVMQPAADALILQSDQLSPDGEVAWILAQIQAMGRP